MARKTHDEGEIREHIAAATASNSKAVRELRLGMAHGALGLWRGLVIDATAGMTEPGFLHRHLEDG